MSPGQSYANTADRPRLRGLMMEERKLILTLESLYKDTRGDNMGSIGHNHKDPGHTLMTLGILGLV